MTETTDMQQPVNANPIPDHLVTEPLVTRVDTALDLLPGFKIDPSLQGQEADLIRSRQEVLRGVFRPLYLCIMDAAQAGEPLHTPESVLQAVITRSDLAIPPELVEKITAAYLTPAADNATKDWLDRALQISLEGDINPLVMLRAAVIAKLPDDVRVELTRVEIDTSQALY